MDYCCTGWELLQTAFEVEGDLLLQVAFGAVEL